MTEYPKNLGNNHWVIEIKHTNGDIKDLHIVLKPDTLNQMGWDSKKDINIHSIMENDHVNLQNKPNLLQSNLESDISH